MTPDPILFDATDTADTAGPSRLWWPVVLVLSTVFWAGLIAVGMMIVGMV